jgi:hypothetical protein
MPDDAGDDGSVPDGTRGAPEALLWAALCLAPEEGVSVPDLMRTTGMSRPWVYQRLQDLVRRGQATQVSRGRWHATGGDQQ